MDGLLIKKEWLDLILNGKKVWEIRGSRTKKRGRIALIESKSGLVVGEVKLVDVIGPLSKSLLIKNAKKHRVPVKTVRRGLRYDKPHAWVFKDAKRYRRPIRYKHPPGAVIWVKDVL